MKIYHALILSFLILLFSDHSTTSKFSKLTKEQNIGLAFELEFEKTKDLKTNTIPSERLIAAKAFADQKRQQKSVANLQWEERGPNNVGGRTRTLIYDLNDPSGNTVMAGSVGGGLWRTTNINATRPNWRPIDDFWSNIAISTMAQNTENPKEIYVGTGEGWFGGSSIRGNGIWKSNDGGITWNQLPKTAGSGYINKLVVAKNGVVLAAVRNITLNTGGIYRSADGGNTLTRVLASADVFSMGADIEVAANGDLYASMGVRYSDGIYKSTDNGLQWTKIYESQPNEQRIELACAPSNPNIVYALFENDDQNGVPPIRRTTDGGATWQDLNTPLWYDQSCSRLSTDWTRGQDWFDLIAAVDPFNENVVYIGGVDLFKTMDGGNSWTQISHWYPSSSCNFPSSRVVHADQHAMAFKPGSNSEILFGNDGGVSQSINANSSNPESIRFIPKSDNYNVTQFYAAATSNEAGSNQFLAGAQDNGTQYYRASGMNRTVEVTGGDGAYCHIDADNPNIQISSYVYNNYRITTNAWQSVSYLNEGQTGRFINPTDYDSKKNVLYGAHESGKYLYIKNVGTNNTIGTKSIEGLEGVISAVSVSPNVSDRVYFATSRGEIVRIDDIGINFLTTTNFIQGTLPFGYISSIAIEKGDDNHLLVSYSNYGKESVWETKNGGNSWTNVEGDLPDMPVRWVEFHPENNNSALIATELGVWSTDGLEDANTIWNPSNNGLANVRVNMLQVRSSDNLLLAATMGRGLFTSSSLSNLEKANLTCSSLGDITVNGTQISITNLIVKNEGSLPVTDDFRITYYLSRDDIFTNTDILLGIDTINGLGVGASSNLSFNIDLQNFNIPLDDYYIGYYIDSDNQIEELSKTDNICYWETARIPVGLPACEAVAIINCGQTISGSTFGQLDYFNTEDYTCFNGSSKFDAPDKIYQINIPERSTIEIRLTNLSDDLDIFLLDSCEPNARCISVSLNPNQETEFIRAFNLSGTYYIVVDAYSNEIQSNFNLSVNCTDIPQGQPNLYVQSKGSITREGNEIDIVGTRYRNNGDGYAERCKIGYYLSMDTIISTDDYLISPGNLPEIPPGNFVTNSLFGNFRSSDLPDGEYYVGVLIDTENVLNESNESDNACYWQTPKITIGDVNTDQPNLVCDNLGLLSLNSNSLNILNLSVKNIGTSKAESCYVGLYLSLDTIINTDDIYLGENFVRPLNPNAKSVEYFSERLSNIPAGSYYVGLIVDYKESITESTRTDNYYFYSKKYVSSGNIPNTAEVGTLEISAYSNGIIEDFVISPNPSQGIFNINLQHPIQESFTVDIIDVGGKIVQRHTYPSSPDTKLNFDIATLKDGVYYVRLKSEQVNISKKLLLLK